MYQLHGQQLAHVLLLKFDSLLYVKMHCWQYKELVFEQGT
jgi:hypothetical protein